MSARSVFPTLLFATTSFRHATAGVRFLSRSTTTSTWGSSLFAATTSSSSSHVYAITTTTTTTCFVVRRSVCIYEPGCRLNDEPLWILRKYAKDSKMGKKYRRVKKHLKLVCREDYGVDRGKEAVEILFQVHRNLARRSVNGEIRFLLTYHFALKHGAKRLDELTEQQLAWTLFGTESKIKVKKKELKQILIEFFRRGQSNLFDNFLRKHNKKLGIKEPIDPEDEYAEPDEEEPERQQRNGETIIGDVIVRF